MVTSANRDLNARRIERLSLGNLDSGYAQLDEKQKLDASGAMTGTLIMP